MEILAPIVIYLIYGIGILFSLALIIATYVLTSLSMYQIAQRRGIEKPWLAWIPVGDMWILGKLADNYTELSSGKKSKLGKWLMITYIALLAVLAIFLVIYFLIFLIVFLLGTAAASEEILMAVMMVIMIALFAVMGLFFIVSIAANVFMYICYFKLFQSLCGTDRAVIYLILTIFISYALPVVLFISRKEDYIPNPYYIDGVPTYNNPAQA